jgi:hypothetical protein
MHDAKTVANELFTTVRRTGIDSCKFLIWRALQDSNLRPQCCIWHAFSNAKAIKPRPAPSIRVLWSSGRRPSPISPNERGEWSAAVHFWRASEALRVRTPHRRTGGIAPFLLDYYNHC